MPNPFARQLAFVDVTANGFESLLEKLKSRGAPLEVVYLEPTRDAIAQMAETLAGQNDLGVIHLISGGSDGLLSLGNCELDRAALALDHASSLGQVGAALATDGDLLLHGCELDRSAAGRKMIDALARLTGTEVSASNPPVEYVDFDGGWDREFRGGLVETPTLWVKASAMSLQATITLTDTAMMNLPSEEVACETLGSSVALENASCQPWETGFSPYFDSLISRGIRVSGASIDSGTLAPSVTGMLNAGGVLVNGGGGVIPPPVTGLAATANPGETLLVCPLPFGSFVPCQSH